MIVGVQETNTAAGQEPGVLSRFLLDPIYPAWAAALFALLILIPKAIKAGRWLRRRWETRHTTSDGEDRKSCDGSTGRVTLGLCAASSW